MGSRSAQQEKTKEESLGMESERWTLLSIAVLLPALCRPHFLKAGLHFLQDFGGVPYYQLNCSLRCLQELYCLLVVFPFHTLEKQKEHMSKCKNTHIVAIYIIEF